MRESDQEIGRPGIDTISRKSKIRKHTDLEVYQRAFSAAMEWFKFSKEFPKEERYSLTDQGRRSSRSVCANLAEAWRKRRYPAAFVARLSDSEAEACESQTWIQFAVECKYLNEKHGRALYTEYDNIIGMLVNMIRDPQSWTLN